MLALDVLIIRSMWINRQTAGWLSRWAGEMYVPGLGIADIVGLYKPPEVGIARL